MPRQRREETAQRWASRLAQFENSYLSVAQFCQSIDCSVGSFYLWKRKLAKPTPAPSAFLRVQTSLPAPSGIEIKLSSGITICIPLTVPTRSLKYSNKSLKRCSQSTLRSHSIFMLNPSTCARVSMDSLGSSKQICNATFTTVACYCSSTANTIALIDVLGY